MKKVVISLLAVLTISANSALAAISFKDVNQKFWAKTYIDEMVQRGYLKGYAGNVFKPSANMSRIEFLVFLSRIASDNYKNVQAIQGESIFYYNGMNNVKWAINDYNKLMVIFDKMDSAEEQYKGMIAMIDTFGDKFDPTKNITRGEVVSLLDNFIDKNKVFLNESELKDISNHKYKNEILVSETLKLVNGYNDNTFRPDNPITRAEVAKIMKIFLSKKDIIKVVN